MITTQQLDKIYNAYSSGQMTPEERSDFENDVNTGVIKLPAGKSLLSPELSDEQKIKIQNAYLNGQMSDSEKKDFENDYLKGHFKPVDDLNDENMPEGIWANLKDMVTGKSKTTVETKLLPDIGQMPELNKMSKEGLKSVFNTLTGSPSEAALALKRNFPKTSVRTDKKGNIFIRSAKDGKEYVVNKPGLDMRDVVLGLITAPVYGAGSLVGGVAGVAAVQAGIEAGQAATGGEFNPLDVVTAAGTEYGLNKIGQAVPYVKEAGKKIANEAISGAESLAKKIPKLRDVIPSEIPKFDLSTSPLQETVNIAENQMNVPVRTRDINPPQSKLGKFFQKTTDVVPFSGASSFAAEQQQARKALVQKTLEDYGVNSESVLPKISESLLQKRSSDISKYSKMKQDVFDTIREKGIAEQLPFNPGNTWYAITNEINNLNRLKTPGAEKFTSILKKYEPSLESGMDMGRVENLRKELGALIKLDENSDIKDYAQKSLKNRIYPAINSDIENYIQENLGSKDVLKWKVANKRLSSLIGDLENNSYKNAINQGEQTPETIKSLLFSSKPSDVAFLRSKLGEEGKIKAKDAIFQKIVDDFRGNPENLSPKTFVNKLEQYRTPIKTFMSKGEQVYLKNVAKVLKLTQGAEDATFLPNTGAQAIPYAIASAEGGALIHNPKSLLAIAPITALIRGYESKPIRSLVLQMKNANPAKQSRILQKLSPLIQSYRNQNLSTVEEVEDTQSYEPSN